MIETFGNVLVFLGIALIFLGIILILTEKNKSRVEAGGVVFVGPFPIFLGASSKTMVLTLVILSLIILTILVLMGVLKW